jgi:hypothetical protein
VIYTVVKKAQYGCSGLPGSGRADATCWQYREMSARADLNGSEIGLRPLTARSIVLSLLLAAHPPQLPARDLVRAAAFFDVAETRCARR